MRLISGRNSPNFSVGISDPMADVAETGRVVLSVWNRRVDQAMRDHDDLRIVVLARNVSILEFSLFEYEAGRFVPSEYEWRVNKNGNFQGYDAKGVHRFTWQPSGSQFTLILPIPASAYRFRIRQHPATVAEARILETIGFTSDWIEAVAKP